MIKPKKYSPETEALIVKVKDAGLNLWPMLGLFKKRSKLKPEIPDEVIQSVCLEYLRGREYLKQDRIKKNFPYFLTVLKQKSAQYFARQNEAEGEAYKKQPAAIKNIFKLLAEKS